VHAFPSLQPVPFALFTGAGQPVAGTHAPIVWHWSVVHVTAVPFVQVPDWHVSPVVQAFASLHVVPFALFTGAGQPVAGTHAPIVWHWSVVHVTVVPFVQVPDWHVSPVVHALASLHVVPFVLFTGAGQPVAGTHAPIVWHWSVVHVTAVPFVQDPDWHVSPVVHAFASLHVVPFVLFTGAGQPVAGTHAPIVWHWSVVQVTVVPPVHAPAWQVSPVVHALLSLQLVPAVLFEHVPTEPVRLHAWHWFVHAVSQQTPLAQKPLAHCEPVVHVSPIDGS